MYIAASEIITMFMRNVFSLDCTGYMVCITIGLNYAALIHYPIANPHMAGGKGVHQDLEVFA